MTEAGSELAAKLQHRDAVNQGEAAPQQAARVTKNVYMEFTEFTRKQIKDLEKKFKEFCSGDNKIGLTELKVRALAPFNVTLLYTLYLLILYICST